MVVMSPHAHPCQEQPVTVPVLPALLALAGVTGKPQRDPTSHPHGISKLIICLLSAFQPAFLDNKGRNSLAET